MPSFDRIDNGHNGIATVALLTRNELCMTKQNLWNNFLYNNKVTY